MTKAQKAYREFLKSDFWLALTAEKKRLIGKCERCPSKRRLQSHHIHYPADWYDTKLEDLEVLCRLCHRIEHFGLKIVSFYGRPWDEEWLLDLTGRLCRRVYSAIPLKRSQARLLIKLARVYKHDPCLKLHIRNVFRASHIEHGDYVNPNFRRRGQ
jgi:hypothetical protein